VTHSIPRVGGSPGASAPGDPGAALLTVEDLRVTFMGEAGPVTAVDGVSYEVRPGRTLGVVGESGSGKTVTWLAALGLTPAATTRVSGRVAYHGRDLLQMPARELRAVRGAGIAMIFQDPMSSLHPFHRVGAQLVEAMEVHREIGRKAAWARAVELLDLVGIPDPGRRADRYPHEFSGGMRQRVMIAMALANEPEILVADEPTTALDVTVQSQILDLLQRLQSEFGMAIVMISHDLGVIAEVADDVAVMYAGRIVERAPSPRIFRAPEHPYTWGLLQSVPRLDTPTGRALPAIPGRPPDLLRPPAGCRFHPRCRYAQPSHATTDPPLLPVPGDPGHEVACLLDPERRRELWASA
jgi:peptide/nickel transport system ATP-binding protein